MSFNARASAHDEFVENIIARFEELGIDFIRTGLERLEHSLFFQSLPNDETGRLLRFFPDLAAGLKETTGLLDAKLGKTVSRAAFEAYQKLSKHGYNVARSFRPIVLTHCIARRECSQILEIRKRGSSRNDPIEPPVIPRDTSASRTG